MFCTPASAGRSIRSQSFSCKWDARKSVCAKRTNFRRSDTSNKCDPSTCADAGDEEGGALDKFRIKLASSQQAERCNAVPNSTPASGAVLREMKDAFKVVSRQLIKTVFTHETQTIHEPMFSACVQCLQAGCAYFPTKENQRCLPADSDHRPGDGDMYSARMNTTRNIDGVPERCYCAHTLWISESAKAFEGIIQKECHRGDFDDRAGRKARERQREAREQESVRESDANADTFAVNAYGRKVQQILADRKTDAEYRKAVQRSQQAADERRERQVRHERETGRRVRRSLIKKSQERVRQEALRQSIVSGQKQDVNRAWELWKRHTQYRSKLLDQFSQYTWKLDKEINSGREPAEGPLAKNRWGVFPEDGPGGPLFAN